MTHERGIRRTRSGWQVYVRIAGEFRSKHFPPETPITELRLWRESQKARHVLSLPTPSSETGLRKDADSYLALVQHMPSYRDRKQRIEAWVMALGARTDRASVTSVDIRRQLERWRAAGKKPGTLNAYRTALLHLFTVLDGKSARNPVRDVPPYREQAAPLVLPSWAVALRVIRAVGWRTNKDGKTRRDNLTRARLTVLLWTGWPASTLGRMTPQQVHWKAKTATTPARRKGRGVEVRTLPLLPGAVAALKALDALDGWGPFDTSSMHKALTRACDKLGLPRFRPYALRHLFLTKLAGATRDDRVVAEMGLHSDVRQVRRYTSQSVPARLRAGVGALAKALK